jgi:hypothetical protein
MTYSPSPLLSFSLHTIHMVVFFYSFHTEQKGEGGLHFTNTTGKRNTGCLANQFKGD